MRKLALAMLGMVLAAGSAQAEAPREKLKATESQLKESQQRAASLQRDAAAAQAELARLQKKLVDLAAAARKRQQRGLELEKRQQELDKKIEASKATLVSRRTEVAELLQSLIRLSHTPPEAVIAMPGELRHTLQAADLLQATTTRLQQRAQDLTRQLSLLQRNEKSLQKTRLALSDEKIKAAALRQTLDEEMQERKKLYTRLDRQQSQEKTRVATLTKQSRSLQQLIAALEQSHARQQKAQQASQALTATPRAKPLAKIPTTPPPIPKGDYASFAAAQGHLSLPVAGFVTTRFGENLGKSGKSQGVTIASRAGNAILAPYAGEVVFTGPFLDYGQMVILRYDGNYHLLLAGFSQIDCVTGQRVAAGEPLGRVGEKLYLELRKAGKPTNPSPWFG